MRENIAIFTVVASCEFLKFLFFMQISDNFAVHEWLRSGGPGPDFCRWRAGTIRRRFTKSGRKSIEPVSIIFGQLGRKPRRIEPYVKPIYRFFSELAAGNQSKYGDELIGNFRMKVRVPLAI